MASMRSKADEEWFVRAYTDLLIDIEKEYGVSIDFTARPTLRRGVLECRWYATFDPWADKDTKPICSYAHEYPNSGAQTLAAFLFAALTRFEKVIKEQFEQRKRAGVIRQG